MTDTNHVAETAEEQMDGHIRPENWKTKTLLVGAVIGVLAGLGAAYLLVQRAEKEGARPEISAGEGVKLSLLVLGVLRQVAQLGE